MSSKPKSRWADDEDDAAVEAQRKREKEEKKRAKLEKQRKQEEELRRKAEESTLAATSNGTQDLSDRPAKRRKTSPDGEEKLLAERPRKLLRYAAPSWGPCRNVENFERLNHIEEGSYGWVSRARETATGEIVALKKLKMDNTGDGFPVTALREIQTLKASRHRHVVDLREIVVGETLQDVFLVMEFLEHDLKTLQEDMAEPFLPSEIKALLLQLTSAVDYLHDNWILHRDLKTSNILMNNRGEIKIADFGMARYFSDPPPPNLTQLVVTLWYRAPELLLGAEKYDTAIDMWSLGCIFGELLTKEPLLQGKNEVDELTKIFELCGIPTEETWPGFKRLPNARSLRLPRNDRALGSVIRAKFPFLTNTGTQLLSSLLSLNPTKRPSASEMLAHPYFREDPRPKATEMFPTFPSKAGQEKRRRRASPNAPKRGDAPRLGGEALDLSGIFAGREEEESGAGFQLRLV
ncbi:serine/threonine protein kinase, CMGC family, CDC2/CDK subfamily [Patellaria atrata CBS 101060]|uniref:cyclin-dependent kinase n=1 Tax=Patellaria atrata CBS 101060 TaxID=1346257 RepID=A0A9P4SI60_9PEZI|nr:serine/threonine protein kinase, CMGC family, CDC2/CDK subfamily [Patellaria atrata CBS 101060]